MVRPALGWPLLLASASLALSCSRDTLLVTSQAPADADVQTPEAGISDAGFQVSDGGLALCGKQVCACANGEDDDGDGLADGLDGECTGAFDNDEATLAVGREKPGNPNCASCFFDANPGAGNDSCRVAANCLATGSPQGAPSACNTCEPSMECVERCLTRTPNGCDCFGCCGVHLNDGSVVNVMLGENCRVEGNTVKGCQACFPNRSCLNECGKCELCPGKTEADLPAECQKGGVTCEGSPVCSPEMPCALGLYCGLGCCLDVL